MKNSKHRETNLKFSKLSRTKFSPRSRRDLVTTCNHPRSRRDFWIKARSRRDLAEIPKSQRPKSRRGLPEISAAKISPRSLNLFGFLKNHSCCTALLKMTEDWRRSLDNRNSAMAVAIRLEFEFIPSTGSRTELKLFRVEGGASTGVPSAGHCCLIYSLMT